MYVCENIHKFQTFNGKKAEGCINQKEPGENYSSANQHKDYGKNFCGIPLYIADRYTVYKHMKNGFKFFEALKYSLYKMF